MVEQLQAGKEPDGKVLVSFSRHIAEGFRAERVPFDRIEGLVRFRGNYSATAFRDGYRDGEHALPGQELVILDFDGGYTIGEAMVDFEPFVGAIATTRNHMKEKHGVVAERFRVLLPVNRPVMLDVEGFKLMMTEVMRSYPQADPACKNIDRMYYGFPDAEVWFLGGGRLLEWELFYRAALARRAEEDRDRQRWRDRETVPGGGQGKGYETFFRNQFALGNRNVTLFRLACWMRDEGVPDVAKQVGRMNAESGFPVDQSELKRIIRRVS
ncbi:MAG: hypothetical protein HGA46_04410 [Chlorobiaceae bacterium]|nr:hypothetical protein [Chlorobiaceae bacterium]